MLYQIDYSATHRLYYQEMDDKQLKEFMENNAEAIKRREITVCNTGHKTIIELVGKSLEGDGLFNSREHDSLDDLFYK